MGKLIRKKTKCRQEFGAIAVACSNGMQRSSKQEAGFWLLGFSFIQGIISDDSLIDSEKQMALVTKVRCWWVLSGWLDVFLDLSLLSKCK